jgi:hypothetical protein
MLELPRFVRYALRFERAFKTDDWSKVRRCFHDDATYTITGTGTAYDGESRGADAIVATFRRMLDQLDRRFDRRIPKLTSWPRMRDGALTLGWKARYVLGGESTVVTGTSRCRFDGGRIRALSDAMVADEVAAWIALLERHAGPIAVG